MTTITIKHPKAPLLGPVAQTLASTLSGDWAVAARLCADKSLDLAEQEKALNRVADRSGLTFEQDPAVFQSAVRDEAWTAEVSVGEVVGALDLFSRLLCGQWRELDWVSALASNTYRADDYEPEDLERIRGRYGRTRNPTFGGVYKPLQANEWPNHPFSSIGIAESVLPAKLAYHAYKQLGGGAAGGPTFGLPGGEVVVKIDDEVVNRIRGY